MHDLLYPPCGLSVADTSGSMPRMAKKEPTEAIHIRLPKSVVQWLDAEAPGEFESRAGLAAKIIIERWRQRTKEPTKPSKR